MRTYIVYNNNNVGRGRGSLGDAPPDAPVLAVVLSRRHSACRLHVPEVGTDKPQPQTRRHEFSEARMPPACANAGHPLIWASTFNARCACCRDALAHLLCTVLSTGEPRALFASARINLTLSHALVIRVARAAESVHVLLQTTGADGCAGGGGGRQGERGAASSSSARAKRRARSSK